jgi:transposase
VVSGIIYVIRNGLQWKDAPAGYGPHKTLYNRFIRWSLMGVSAKRPPTPNMIARGSHPMRSANPA